WSEAAVGKYLSDETHRPFDLEHGPMFRVRLLKRAAEDRVLQLSVHHIVADFWSLAVLISELGILYVGEQNGESLLLPSLALQYTDYVQWQNELLESEEGERLWNYWSQ